MLRLWRTEWFERIPPIEQVDFGNGHQVSAADLVDGHSRRLTTASDRQNSTDVQSVPVHIDHELQATIRIVAPTLAPLTELAEEIAQGMPDTTPTPYFRDTLNQALTRTHRQHHAQRVLGIRPTEVERHRWHIWLVVSLILTVVSLSIIGLQQEKGTAPTIL